MIAQDSATLSRKLAWGCRRGMLELDLMLSKLAGQLETMDDAQLASVEKMLTLGDQQLWNLLVARTATPEKSYAGLVEQLNQQRLTEGQGNNER